MLVYSSEIVSGAAGVMTDRSHLATIVQKASSHRDDHCVICQEPPVLQQQSRHVKAPDSHHPASGGSAYKQLQLECKQGRQPWQHFYTHQLTEDCVAADSKDHPLMLHAEL